MLQFFPPFSMEASFLLIIGKIGKSELLGGRKADRKKNKSPPLATHIW